MKFHELSYAPANESPQESAQRAIKILEVVAAKDAACLFYCIQASNILALAGLRAQSPYNEFRPDFQKQELLQSVLHEHGYEIMLEQMPYYHETRRIFSLHCVAAFGELPERYKVLKPFWKTPKKLADTVDFFLWSQHIQLSLVRLMEDNALPREWLLDWWAPHSIRFGMLLGYPGQAITSHCWGAANHTGGKPVEPEMTPSIPFQGAYTGTYVEYTYASSLRGDPVLADNEKLWAEVLRLVYDAFPEERLLGMREFKKEYEAFKHYDEG